jgi:phenylpropionate dioxygenase-like ring-hydroxylating dioxygenase large terminal subunit
MTNVEHSRETLFSTLSSYGSVEMGDARSLPLDAYTSQDLFDAEIERIFRHEWICVGRTEQVGEVGDWFSADVAGEPVVVTRNENGEINALSAVCRHRYMTVAQGTGNSRRLVCPYHRWNYNLDGALVGTPLMDVPQRLDGSPCRLPAFHVETWLGFVFVSLAANPEPLAPQLCGAADTLAPYEMSGWRTLIGFDETWPGNWKLALETALEGYHLDGLHAGPIADMLGSRGSHFVEATSRWSCFRIDVDFASELGAATKPFADAYGGVDATSSPTISIHPHVNISCSPAGAVWLNFHPLEPGHTRVTGGYLVPPSEFERINADSVELDLTRAVIAQLNQEDASATIDLQRNARTRYAEPGILNEREEALVHFYRYLANQLVTNDLKGLTS